MVEEQACSLMKLSDFEVYMRDDRRLPLRGQFTISAVSGSLKTKKSIHLYTLAVSPSLGSSQQHKETTKTMGVLLRSSSNDEGPDRVWMALQDQHSPFSPVFHNLRRFINAISPIAPTTGLPL